MNYMNISEIKIYLNFGEFGIKNFYVCYSEVCLLRVSYQMSSAEGTLYHW